MYRSQVVQLPAAERHRSGRLLEPARFEEPDALLRFLASLRGTSPSVRRRGVTFQGSAPVDDFVPAVDDLEALWTQAPDPDGLTTAAGPTAVLLPQETWMPYMAFDDDGVIRDIGSVLEARPRWDPLDAGSQRHNYRQAAGRHELADPFASSAAPSHPRTPPRGSLPYGPPAAAQSPEAQHPSSLNLALNLLALDGTPGKLTVFGRRDKDASTPRRKPGGLRSVMGLLSPNDIVGAHPESDSDDAASVGPLPSGRGDWTSSAKVPGQERLVRDASGRPVLVWTRTPATTRALWAPGEDAAAATALAAAMGSMAALTALQVTVAGDDARGSPLSPSRDPLRRPATMAVLRRLERAARDRVVVEGQIAELARGGRACRGLAAAAGEELRRLDAHVLALVARRGRPAVLHLQGARLRERAGPPTGAMLQSRLGVHEASTTHHRLARGQMTNSGDADDLIPGCTLARRAGLTLLQVDVAGRRVAREIGKLGALLAVPSGGADEREVLEWLHRQAQSANAGRSFGGAEEGTVAPCAAWRLLLGALRPWAEAALLACGAGDGDAGVTSERRPCPGSFPDPPPFLQELARPLRVLAREADLLASARRAVRDRDDLEKKESAPRTTLAEAPVSFLDLLQAGPCQRAQETSSTPHQESATLRQCERPGALLPPVLTPDLQSWLVAPVVREYRRVSAAVFSFLILEDPALADALVFVRNRLFGLDGDWADALAASLSIELDRLEPLSEQALDRVSAAAEALSGAPPGTPARLRLSGGPRLAALPMAPDSLDALGALQLEAELPAHAAAVASPAAMERFSGAFTAQLRVRRVLNMLSSVRKALPSARCRRLEDGASDERQAADRVLQQLRVMLWKARHVCLVLLQLQHRQATLGEWAAFQGRWEATKAALRSGHESGGDADSAPRAAPRATSALASTSPSSVPPFSDLEDLSQAFAVAADCVWRQCVALDGLGPAVAAVEALLPVALALATRTRRVVAAAAARGWDGARSSQGTFDRCLLAAWEELQACGRSLAAAQRATLAACDAHIAPGTAVLGLLRCQLDMPPMLT